MWGKVSWERSLGKKLLLGQREISLVWDGEQRVKLGLSSMTGMGHQTGKTGRRTGSHFEISHL